MTYIPSLYCACLKAEFVTLASLKVPSGTICAHLAGVHVQLHDEGARLPLQELRGRRQVRPAPRVRAGRMPGATGAGRHR